MTDVAPLSVEELLARSAAAVKSGKTTAKMSAVQKLLAQRDTPLEDTVQLSAVQKIVQAQKKAADAKENYFDSDDYLKLKVNQLKSQLAIYTTLPGLDPNGAIVGGIEQEVKDIIKKQQDKLKALTDKGDDAKKKLEEQQKAREAELVTSKDMLSKVRGETTAPALSKEVQKLLENAKKGASVNTTA